MNKGLEDHDIRHVANDFVQSPKSKARKPRGMRRTVSTPQCLRGAAQRPATGGIGLSTKSLGLHLLHCFRDRRQNLKDVAHHSVVRL